MVNLETLRESLDQNLMYRIPGKTIGDNYTHSYPKDMTKKDLEALSTSTIRESFNPNGFIGG